MKLSKKQNRLINDIQGTDEKEIYVLGSTQSGKTYSIALGTILYAQNLSEEYPNEEFDGAIVGWSVATMKKNILDVMLDYFKKIGKELQKNKDYKWGNNEKWIKIKNITFTFFPFNNVLSFNNIVGRPLIYVWVDESARIYTAKALQEQFNQFPGRQMSYANNPYIKTIHSFNVEGNENHDYKRDYLEKKINAKHYVFFPYDNPKIDTEEAMRKVIELFPPGSLRRQKVYNEWCVAEGLVFGKIPKISVEEFQKEWIIRDIVIAIDYGSVHPTVMTPLALCWNKETNQWRVFRLVTLYYDPVRENTTPTTEFFSKQLQVFIRWLGGKYGSVKLTNIPIDSAAAHFHNRLLTDGIQHELVNKDSMTVNESVELMQSLFEKEYLIIVDTPTIRYFNNDGTPIFSGKDDSAIEIASYQYDKIKSMNTGQNVFKKDKDDATDSIRYGVMTLRDTGRIPNV